MVVTKKAFTLVELIVVITILTILATIGFMGYQQYGIDVRNTKRTLDLSNVSNLILVKDAEGYDPLNFIGGNGENKLSMGNINIGGQPAMTSIYNAGTINYTALSIKKEDFSDPNGEEYRIGATNTYGGRFEIAASLEIGADRVSYIKGNYTARGDEIAAVESVSGNIVTLAVEESNRFKTKDMVEADGSGSYGVLKASRDSVTLTFENDMTGVSTINLALPETPGLLSDKDDLSLVLTHDSTTTLPY